MVVRPERSADLAFNVTGILAGNRVALGTHVSKSSYFENPGIEASKHLLGSSQPDYSGMEMWAIGESCSHQRNAEQGHRLQAMARRFYATDLDSFAKAPEVEKSGLIFWGQEKARNISLSDCYSRRAKKVSDFLQSDALTNGYEVFTKDVLESPHDHKIAFSLARSSVLGPSSQRVFSPIIGTTTQLKAPAAGMPFDTFISAPRILNNADARSLSSADYWQETALGPGMASAVDNKTWPSEVHFPQTQVVNVSFGGASMRGEVKYPFIPNWASGSNQVTRDELPMPISRSHDNEIGNGIGILEMQRASFHAEQEQLRVREYSTIMDTQREAMLSDIRAEISAWTDRFLFAPFDGVVTAVFKQPGDRVAAGDPVLRLEDRETQLLVGRLEATRLPDVGIRAKVTKLADASFVPVDGTIIAVRTASEPDGLPSLDKCEVSFRLDKVVFAFNEVLGADYEMEW